MLEAYNVLYTVSAWVLGIGLLCCLVRAILGPRIADRLIAVNVMGTLTIILICVVTFLKGEGYLVDVAITYALLSFLAVVLLSKVYMGVSRENRRKEAAKHERS